MLLLFKVEKDSLYLILFNMKTKKLQCIITGKSFVAGGDYLQKKLAKCDNDISLLEKSYICKEAKDLLKQGYTVEQTRKLLNSDCTDVVPENIISHYSKNSYGVKKTTALETLTGMTKIDTDPDVLTFINKIYEYTN